MAIKLSDVNWSKYFSALSSWTVDRDNDISIKHMEPNPIATIFASYELTSNSEAQPMDTRMRTAEPGFTACIISLQKVTTATHGNSAVVLLFVSTQQGPQGPRRLRKRLACPN